MDRVRRCSETRAARSRGPVGRRRRRGVILIIALVFLVVLTSLALNEMRRTTVQQSVATGERDRLFAQQNAELALRDAERDVLGVDYLNRSCVKATYSYCRDVLDARTGADGTAFASAASRFTEDCTDGQCGGAAAPADDNPADPNWIAFRNCVTYGRYTGASGESGSGNAVAPARQPCYALEWLTANNGGRQSVPIIRITAWGWGKDGSAPVVIQEVFNRGAY
ncbi:pilus assembly PilX family protein [Derxia lacustris]|uniref:pilus assembly PilX family protein n=1 Tax=Derxia lacustris TaxID=764842 RepID=UPI001593FDF8|nr:hypothetical protein [Derxia lacustris]